MVKAKNNGKIMTISESNLQHEELFNKTGTSQFHNFFVNLL